MSEENTLESKLKRARSVAGVLSIVAVLSIMSAIYFFLRGNEAERKVELVEKLSNLQLDSCSVRNEDLTNYVQELLYTLDYEKKKNQAK